MMNLLNANAESFIAKIAASDDLDNLGVVCMHIDPYIRPKVLPSRNIPIAFRQIVKAYLDQRTILSKKHKANTTENILLLLMFRDYILISLSIYLINLDQLVHRQVISPVHEPTHWVSQRAVVKKNDDIRICIDPQSLNTTLKRELYKLPVLDDILPGLGHAKIFPKLDVKEASWHVALDEASSSLTTMITPFG